MHIWKWDISKFYKFPESFGAPHDLTLVTMLVVCQMTANLSSCFRKLAHRSPGGRLPISPGILGSCHNLPLQWAAEMAFSNAPACSALCEALEVNAIVYFGLLQFSSFGTTAPTFSAKGLSFGHSLSGSVCRLQFLHHRLPGWLEAKLLVACLFVSSFIE